MGPWTCLRCKEQDVQCSSDSRYCWALFIWACCVHPGFFYPSIHFWPWAEGEGLGGGENLKIPDELGQGKESLSVKGSTFPAVMLLGKPFSPAEGLDVALPGSQVDRDEDEVSSLRGHCLGKVGRV